MTTHDNETKKKTKKSSGRTGRAISPLERTFATIRIDKGESIETIARELRVLEQTVRGWMKDWRHREGAWRHWRDGLLPIEEAEGYELGEPDPDAGVTVDGSPNRRLPLRRARAGNAAAIEAARKRVAEAQRAVVAVNREMFVAQLEATVNLASSPAFETEERAYRALDDEGRALVTPAWDLYLIAVEELRTKMALAIAMARRELVPTDDAPRIEFVDTSTGRSTFHRPDPDRPWLASPADGAR